MPEKTPISPPGTEASAPTTVENTPMPSTGTKAPADRDDSKSTADISKLLAHAAFQAPKEVPLNDRDLLKGTIRCYEIQEIKDDIDDLKDDRDSIYRVQAQVTTLKPNLEANTLLKPDTKRLLEKRVDDLIDLVNQGITIDTNFTTMEMETSDLEDQHLDLMIDHYNPATNPAEKPKTTLEEIDKKVKEYTKETNRLKRSFESLHPRIADSYMNTRDALPGTLNLKPFSTLTSSSISEDSQPPRKKQRLGGSDSNS